MSASPKIPGLTCNLGEVVGILIAGKWHDLYSSSRHDISGIQVGPMSLAIVDYEGEHLMDVQVHDLGFQAVVHSEDTANTCQESDCIHTYVISGPLSSIQAFRLG